MKKIKVFVPAHLTGFFEICSGSTLLTTGSRGAGLSISKGVLTEVSIEESKKDNITVYINDKKEKDAKVTKYVVNYYLNKIKDANYNVEINHKVEVPIGAGFGTSGAAALGTSYAMNLLLNLNQTRNECAQIAHIAEVYCKTGLGDVIAQTYGGVEIRLEPGAPGYGKIDNILCPPDIKVICFTLGKIDTNSILNDETKKEEINKSSRNLTDKLLEEPNIFNLMKLSYKFALNANLIPDEINEILKELHVEGILTASMIMLGKSLFCVVKEKEQKRIVYLIRDKFWKGDLYITDIDYQGARIIGV